MSVRIEIPSKCAKASLPSVKYGTAGFRTNAEILDYILYRMGILAAVRSMFKKAAVGLMITASHNPEQDNGVKLVDPMGEMLEQTWEVKATQLVALSDDQVESYIIELLQELNICADTPATVILARDTRPSSLQLSKAAEEGAKALKATISDCGWLTTPQLHYMVRCTNSTDYGQPSVEGYNEKLAQAYRALIDLAPSDASNYQSEVLLDCAHGVGALQIEPLRERISSVLNINVVNKGHGKLNHLCGADYVKVQQTIPFGVSAVAGEKCASFDGDADRLVYYYTQSGGSFRLLDGDKIATLLAGFLGSQLTAAGISLELGLVQTAYANGSSTRYIAENMGVPVSCVPTGVKHLHHRAVQYEIGVYFEANGHGTVVYSDKATEVIRSAKTTADTEVKRRAAMILNHFIDLTNQTVGDATSDMLLVECVLRHRGWSVQQWNDAYTDLPSRQLKVKVADRCAVTTTDAERRAVTPTGLQQAVDDLVKTKNSARAFVRPSGTEDVVRVYAEADTQTDADELALLVSRAVYDLAAGVGDRP